MARDTKAAVLWTVQKKGDTVRAVMVAVSGRYELQLLAGTLVVFRETFETVAEVKATAVREYRQLKACGWTIVEPPKSEPS
jgi:hypothetical protein